MRELKGQYGFLTDYSEMSENAAQEKIRQLWDMGIREFQFYDWFADYSTPTRGEHWLSPFNRSRPIYLSTIRYYIKEINRLGGRAWAYVQAVGAEEDNLADGRICKLIMANDEPHVHARRFPTYFANRAWGERMINRWALAIKELGFTGIHWDTLAKQAGDPGAETAGFHEFLAYTHAQLTEMHLEQTTNFVSLAWWDREIVSRYVAFPYVEVWNDNEKTQYYEKLQELFSRYMPASDKLRAVIAYYPFSPDKEPTIVPIAVQESRMINRFKEALMHHVSYLILGDGNKRLVKEYFLSAIPLTDDIKHEMMWLQFKENLSATKRLTLKTYDRKHVVCAEEGGGGEVHARYSIADNWRRFKVGFFDGHKISLKTYDDKHYVCAQDGGGRDVHARYTDNGVWQKFKVTFFGNNQISLQADNNQYLSARNEGGDTITADKNASNTWERFYYKIKH